MTETGVIERFTLARLLQRLFVEKQSGLVIIKGENEIGRLALSHGRILAASGSGVRSAVRNAYLRSGAGTPAQLEEVMDELAREESLDIPIARALERFGAPREVLWEAHRKMLQLVVTDFLMWCGGAYAFVPGPPSESKTYSFPIGDFLVDAGQEMFEMRHDLTDLVPCINSDPRLELLEDGWNQDSGEIHRILHLMRNGSSTAELQLNLMEIASHLTDRAVLFAVEGGELRPLSQIGVPRLTKASLDGHVTELLMEASGVGGLIAEALETGEAALGPLHPNRANSALVEMLEGDVPGNSIVLPLTISDEVRLFLYGDVKQGRRLCRTELLECALLQMSLVIENQRLRDVVTGFRNQRLQPSQVSPQPESFAPLADVEAGLKDTQPQSLRTLLAC